MRTHNDRLATRLVVTHLPELHGQVLADTNCPDGNLYSYAPERAIRKDAES
jgi:hypothetical protein